MYYKLVSGKDIFELNPGLRAVPSFNEMTDMQMKYICLVCDPSNDNPVRTLQGRARREKAAALAGYKLEPDGKRLAKQARDIVDGKNKYIEVGISNFKALHYDERTDTYESVVNQIGQIRDFLKSNMDNNPTKLKQALKLGVELPELIEAKQKLEVILNVNQSMKPELDDYSPMITELPPQDESTASSSDQELSTLDRFMQNRRTIK